MSEFSQKLDLRQSQTLVMTPQLQQAIKLLQLNNMELNDYIEEELAHNPLLEKDETPPEGSETIEAAPETSSDDMQSEFDQGWTGNENDNTVPQDFDAGSSMANMGSGGSLKFENAEDSFENRLSNEESLRDHLINQLHMAFDDQRDRMIGALLIDQLDEAGYVRADQSELAARLGCSEDRIERLLGEMKQFDPTGIFASDLKDCLALQLEERNLLDAPMRILLDNLQDLADHNMTGLAEKCGVNTTYLQDMIGDIRALNPKPAGLFDHFVVQTAIPDVLMKRLPKNIGGGWRVELNHETLPRVLVNQDYYTEVAQVTKKKEDKAYLSDKLHAANWIVRALDQRAQTILKVAGELVEQQDAFFNYGIEFLRPLTLKDIAEVVEVHESTVSRVTTNKYIGTPRGLFELKYFFTSGLTGSDGISHSSESVKARIKSLIDEEDPKKILSDDKLVTLLKEEGIDIARRTVAKYREALGLGSSVQRRKKKRNL